MMHYDELWLIMIYAFMNYDELWGIMRNYDALWKRSHSNCISDSLVRWSRRISLIIFDFYGRLLGFRYFRKNIFRIFYFRIFSGYFPNIFRKYIRYFRFFAFVFSITTSVSVSVFRNISLYWQGLTNAVLSCNRITLGVFPNCHEYQKIDCPVLKNLRLFTSWPKTHGFFGNSKDIRRERLHYVMFVT